MSLVDSLKNSLGIAQSLVEGGKVNLTVNNPVIQISAKDAIEVAQPYILGLLTIIALGVLMFVAKRATI